ncbi:MAG: glycosyltransferase family 4 protein [Candidatus Limisoma sp.]
MKIVHVCICSFFNEKIIYQDFLLSKYHRRLGHDVTIIASTECGHDSKGRVMLTDRMHSTLDGGIKLVRLRPAFPIAWINAHLFLVRGLEKAILAEQPDLLFVHNLGSFSYLAIPRVARQLPKMKVVFDNHGDKIKSCRMFITKFLHGVLYRHILSPKFEKISSVFYGVTPARCDFLHDVYGIDKSKIRLLVMGADDEHLHLDRKVEIRRAIRKQYGIADDEFLVVTGGRIDLEKRIHLLAEAVNSSSEKKIRLLAFGSVADDVKERIEACRSERVNFIGWIDSSKAYDYFFAADLVAFPGTHSVLWEQAVASRVPCLFSRFAGFDHVDIGGNCIFLDETTPDYYRQTVESLYRDKQRYSAMLAAADSPAADRMLYSRIAQQVLNDV